jgi:hypothetical protein
VRLLPRSTPLGLVQCRLPNAVDTLCRKGMIPSAASWSAKISLRGHRRMQSLRYLVLLDLSFRGGRRSVTGRWWNRGRLLMGVVAVLWGTGCQEAARPSSVDWQGVLELLGDTSRALVGLGTFDEGGDGPSFGVILSGTVAPSGGWFAIADLYSPHVRVFREDGSEVSSFLKQGPGPLESSAPRRSLLADSDSTLLVLESDQLRRFSIDGQLLGRLPLRSGGFRAQAMGRGCGDVPVLIGVRHPLVPGIELAWVHRISSEADGELRLVPLWSDGEHPPSGIILSDHRIVRLGDFVLLSRETSRGTREETLRCAEGGSLHSVSVPADPSAAPVPGRMVIGRSLNQKIQSFEADKEYHRTVAAHPLSDSVLLRVGQITYAGDVFREVDVQLDIQAGVDTVASLRHSGYFKILDLTASRALTAHEEPFPRVFLFDLSLPFR